MDAAGRIRLANDEAAWSLQRPSEVLQTLSIDEVIAPLDTLRDAAKNRRDSSLEFERPGGGRGRLGFTVSPVLLGEGAGETMYSIIFRDISRESSVATERDRLLRLASMGAAAPTIIHEVKNSLTSIIMGLELLSIKVVAPDVLESVQSLLTESRRITNTVQGFGAVGRDLRTAAPRDINPMLTDAMNVLAKQASSAGVSLSWRFDPLPPLTIEPAVLHAIVSNLVTNSIHACESGATIRVSATVDNHRFVLKVQDTGCGMTPEVIDRCTDLFFSTRPGGNGIGLALCREAIHAAGGDLHIMSVPKDGTEMTVVVPGVTVDSTGEWSWT